MNTHHVGELAYLSSPLLDTPHGFSTRLGGVSGGYLASLNLGLHRGDSEAAVAENYRRFCAAVGVRSDRLVTANQVHGVTVRRVGLDDVKKDLFAPVNYEADGLVTDVPGVTLVVYAADCVPILFFDPVRRVAAACHAGWRGTAAAMAAQTVKTMGEYGCKPADIRAAVGPCIGQCCFETDGDVPEAMTEKLGDLAGPHITQTGAKFHVDLKEINRAVLLNAGLSPEHIDVSGDCTCCDPERYWSHRYTHGLRGSQAAMVMIKEEKG